MAKVCVMYSQTAFLTCDYSNRSIDEEHIRVKAAIFPIVSESRLAHSYSYRKLFPKDTGSNIYHRKAIFSSCGIVYPIWFVYTAFHLRSRFAKYLLKQSFFDRQCNWHFLCNASNWQPKSIELCFILWLVYAPSVERILQHTSRMCLNLNRRVNTFLGEII